MSAEENANSLEEAAQKATEQHVDAPVAQPQVQSQEPQPKKRGRRAYPRDADGRIIRPDGSVGPRTGAARKSTAKEEETWTDEESGKVIQGAFMAAGMVPAMGRHWKLFPHEQREMGECFGPIFRRYPEYVPQFVKLLIVAPTVVGIVGPRLAIQQMVWKKEIEADQSRAILLKMLSFMEAEKHLDLKKQMEESAEWLKSQVDQTAIMAKLMEEDPKLAEALQNVGKK